jgi:hypothetical protein
MSQARFAAAVGCAALALAVFLYATWQHGAAPGRQAQTPTGKPPPAAAATAGGSLHQVARPPTDAGWNESMAALEDDLHAAYERSLNERRADAWLFAAKVRDACALALGADSSPSLRRQAETTLAALNSARALDPDRPARLRAAVRQKQAAEALERRCRNFVREAFGLQVQAINDARARARSHDSGLGALMRAVDAMNSGAGDAGELSRLLLWAFGTRERIVMEYAWQSLAGQLFDARLPPPQRPPYAAAAALVEALEHVYGVTLNSCGLPESHFERLLMEAVPGPGCEERTDPVPNEPERARAEYAELVTLYADALRRRDIGALMQARPQPRR